MPESLHRIWDCSIEKTKSKTKTENNPALIKVTFKDGRQKINQYLNI